MTEEDVRVVGRVYEAWNQGQDAELYAAMDPEIEFALPEGGMDAGIPRGPEQVRHFMEKYVEAFEEFKVELEKIFETDDGVVAFVRISGKGRGSGVEIEVRPAHRWTFRHGKVKRLEVFTARDKQEVLLGDSALVLAAYEALNRGDHAAWVSLFHPDAELHEVANVPDAAVYRGHTELQKWVDSIIDIAGPQFGFEVEQITDAGGATLARVRAHGRGVGGDVPIEIRVFHVFDVEGGKIRRVRGYLEEQAARDALGPSPG